jgi:hypothetical protein
MELIDWLCIDSLFLCFVSIDWEVESWSEELVLL